jgi:hypothetical protein
LSHTSNGHAKVTLSSKTSIRSAQRFWRFDLSLVSISDARHNNLTPIHERSSKISVN